MIAGLALAAALSAAAPGPDGLMAGAFRDAQLAVSTRAAAALSRGAARLAAADPALAAAVASRDREARALAAAQADEAAARADGTTSAIGAASEAGARAAARLDAADRAIAAGFPGYAQLIDVAPLDLAEIEPVLAPDEAILLLQPTATATFGFVVTRDRADWFRAAADERDLAGIVRALRAGLDPAGLLRSGEDAAPLARRGRAPPFARSLAHQLYAAIWAPAEPLLTSKRIVYVVTGGSLAALPLAVLVTAPPQGRDDDPAALRETAWLIRRHALVTLPSVASLRALRAAGPPHGGRAFAGFGDPALPPGLYPPLPGTGDELRRIARVLEASSSSVVTGAAATEAAVKAAPLGDDRVIAFATHGLLAGEGTTGGEPALLFTPPATTQGDDDGRLTASEAATLSLSADWVILSACNTAAGDGGGEGLSGLARGFFSAGARALLVSHWRVRDDVAARLTVATMRRWVRAGGRGRAEALAGAMVAMIDDRRHPEFASPSLWAPFVVAGDGR